MIIPAISITAVSPQTTQQTPENLSKLFENVANFMHSNGAPFSKKPASSNTPQQKSPPPVVNSKLAGDLAPTKLQADCLYRAATQKLEEKTASSK